MRNMNADFYAVLDSTLYAADGLHMCAAGTGTRLSWICSPVCLAGPYVIGRPLQHVFFLLVRRLPWREGNLAMPNNSFFSSNLLIPCLFLWRWLNYVVVRLKCGVREIGWEKEAEVEAEKEESENGTYLHAKRAGPHNIIHPNHPSCCIAQSIGLCN